MYPMKVLMKYSRPNSCANPSLIARQERAGMEILLLGGVWNYSTILGSSSLGSGGRGSIFAWYQVSPSKTLRDPPSPNQATSLHSQSRLSASMQRVLCACDECSTTSIYSDPKRFNTSIYSDPTEFSKKNMGLLGLAIICHLGFSKTNNGCMVHVDIPLVHLREKHSQIVRSGGVLW